MFSTGLLVAALVAAPALVSAGDIKDLTELFPNGLHDPLIKFDTIKSAAVKNTLGSSVPQICKDYGSGKAYGMDGDIQCDVNNMEAREVFYEDCEQSWTLCRCPDADLSLDTMQERFGQVPPGIRSYVGAALAVKAGGCSAVCFNGNFLRFHGDCGMTVFLHEAGHALDSGVSGSDEFKAAIDGDSCAPDNYAKSSNAEEFTQVNVLYTYEKQFEPIPADKGCLQKQWDVLANDARVNEAQDAKQCLADKRPFTTPNDNAPPPPPPETEAPPPPAETEAPAPPTETEAPPAPEPTSTPKPPCNSAKFRFRRAIKRGLEVATEYVAGKVSKLPTVTIPYSG